MNCKDLSWRLFETTGEEEEKKEAGEVGNSPDRGDNNQGS